MEVELTITDHYAMKTRIVVRQLPVTLGRDENADVCLKDPWASHRHCTLSEISGTLIICDLASKNGIFLHGHRVSESHLFPGDRFTIGRTEIAVHYVRGTAADGDADRPVPQPAEPNVASVSPPETMDLLYGVSMEPPATPRGD